MTRIKKTARGGRRMIIITSCVIAAALAALAATLPDESPDFTAAGNYAKYLGSLNQDDIASVAAATNEYTKRFSAVTDTPQREKGYEYWQNFKNKILDAEGERLNHDKSLGEIADDAMENGKRVRGRLMVSGELRPATREYIERLNREHINLYTAEMYVWLELDPDYVTKTFCGFLGKGYREFVRLRNAEIKEGFTDDACLTIPWDAVRLRVIKWEKYCSAYPDSPQLETAAALAGMYLNVYLTGLDNSRIYDWHCTASICPLRRDVKASYERFMRENTDSNSCPIVREYYNYLKGRDFMVDMEAAAKYLEKFKVESYLGVQPIVR